MLARSLLLLLLALPVLAQGNSRWTEKKATDWYAKQGWLVGGNYIPASAINQLEMWQADSFDLKRIDLELGWAEKLGLNTMRVFLHDALWTADAKGFQKRINQFLQVAAKHKIKPLFVLFDSCWDPFPALGKQHAPTPGVHNSGWVQNPGAKLLTDPAATPQLEAYVKGVVGAFAKDARVLGWDVWNEPDNLNGSSYGAKEPKDKLTHVERLLPQVFAWARAAGATQPLTSGVWQGDWSKDEKLSRIARIQLEQSDVISFHNYDPGPKFRAAIDSLKRYQRPILCTEYMARGNGSTFEGSLPIAKEQNVAAYNWGFVAGKTQTFLPWDSWKKPYVDREPAIWFHEILKTDGSPYDARETTLIVQLTKAKGK